MSILNTANNMGGVVQGEGPTVEQRREEPVARPKPTPAPTAAEPVIDMTKNTRDEYAQVKESLQLLTEGVRLWGNFLEHTEVTVGEARELVMKQGGQLIRDLWSTGVVPKPVPAVSAEELKSLKDLDMRHKRGDFRQGNY